MPRWTIGRMMFAVAVVAGLLCLPARFGRAGSIVLGLALGVVGAAIVPAMLVCKIQSQFPSRRDARVAWMLAESGLIFAVLG